MSASSPDDLFLQELGTIESAVRFACRRGRLFGADAEDFESAVKLKIIENDYAILRKWEGRCSFRIFIGVVVQRLLLDHRNHLLGKWHPSAEAKRLGDDALQIEQLIHRDHMSREEAVQFMLRLGCERSRDELLQLADRLPQRRGRLREVSSDALEYEQAPAIEAADSAVLDQERHLLGRAVSACVRQAIDSLPTEDRTIFRLRFEAGMTVAQIARALGIEQKPVYRRIDRHLREFRARLESAGMKAAVIEEVVGSATIDLDFGFAMVNAEVRPSHDDWEARVREEEQRA